jgi:dTDP-4-amino-4,6-dideoxygalactose transaminase
VGLDLSRTSAISYGSSMRIDMVDLRGQHEAIKHEIDEAIESVIEEAAFIRGPVVGEFECKLAGTLGGSFALGVANGTDALQIAMMALEIGPGDEVITSAFTFVATGEAAALLGATPVFADIDPQTFNIDPASIEALITPATKAIVPVHLFGQPADMDPILEIARTNDLHVIEDNAQSIGASYREKKTGFLGDLGCLSFFPSKNLGCFGDGGAVLTNDEHLYRKARMISNHGSEKKYHNERVGINSRLDTIQAAVLKVKLKYLDEYNAARRRAASFYDALFAECEFISTPHHGADRTHVFHQYTVRISEDVPGGRDGLSEHLDAQNIPHAVYYPVPLHRLPVFSNGSCRYGDLSETEQAAREVLSLPMHTELTEEQQEHIGRAVLEHVDGRLR